MACQTIKQETMNRRGRKSWQRFGGNPMNAI